MKNDNQENKDKKTFRIGFRSTLLEVVAIVTLLLTYDKFNNEYLPAILLTFMSIYVGEAYFTCKKLNTKDNILEFLLDKLVNIILYAIILLIIIALF